MYNIRNKEGYLTAMVSPMIMRRMVRMYVGEWSEVKGVQRYTFKERAAFGDGEISVVIFAGSYIDMEQ